LLAPSTSNEKVRPRKIQVNRVINAEKERSRRI
jgi:hypothetical protein